MPSSAPQTMPSDQADLPLMKPQEGPDPRPKEYFDRFHKRSRTREPDCFVYGTIHVLMFLLGVPLFQIHCIGAENVPEEGPVILAPNHFSFMDHFLMAVFLPRLVRFMAKSQMFKRPLQFIYTHGGVFPVRRKCRDEEPFITAKAILAKSEGSGGMVAMYCEGGRSRTREISKEAKRGIGRLAVETGAPVVPIAICGSNNLRDWKRDWKRPWRIRLPKITVVFGEPLRYQQEDDPSREHQQIVADDVLLTIRRLHSGTKRTRGWFTSWILQGRRILAYKGLINPV